jgi:hypothetical protein
MNLRRNVRIGYYERLEREDLPFLRRHEGNHYDRFCGHHVVLEICHHLSAIVLAVGSSRGLAARLNNEAALRELTWRSETISSRARSILQ